MFNFTVNVPFKGSDPYWIALALEHWAKINPQNLTYAPERAKVLADYFHNVERQRSSAWCSHDDCATAIEKAAGFDSLTIPRL